MAEHGPTNSMLIFHLLKVEWSYLPLTITDLYIVYIISHLLEEMYENQISVFIEISCPPMKRQTIICISDFW
jgi:hypothetical protein